MSSIIPIERFICYKQNDRKRKVQIYVESKDGPDEPIVTDYFDNSYKLVFIKPYTEDGKNPEMELILDGTTRYNIKYYDRFNKSVETLENVSFNNIVKDAMLDYPRYKNILDQYCANFELGLYKGEIKESLMPYETDEEVIYYYRDKKTVEYVDTPYLIDEYNMEIYIRGFNFTNEETEIKIPINGTRFVNYLKKNNINTHVINVFIFTAKTDSNGNIVWDIFIGGGKGKKISLVIRMNNVNINDLGIEIDGDVSEGDSFTLHFEENWGGEIYIDTILDVEEVKD